MKLSCWMTAALALTGCAVEPIETSGPEVFDETLQVDPGPGEEILAAPSADPYAETEERIRFGTVTWNLIASDCPPDNQALWSIPGTGWLIVIGDQIRLDIDTMPELTGTLVDGSADVSGNLVFWMGEDVTCSVTGKTRMGLVVVQGEVTEVLSSESTLNCATAGEFVMTLEP